jgi:DNA-binding response OmpR family regulator
MASYVQQNKMVGRKTKTRILIVDDEPDLTTLFQLVLERTGFEVKTYTDSALALSEFKPGSFDLVILDIKMPKMDGFELYRELKKKDSGVKVCFLTASEMYYEKYRKDEYDSMDKDLFIQKPVSNEALVEGINKILADKEEAKTLH